MPSGSRRLRFAIIVMVSQLLLIALAIAWVVQMSMIAMNGSIYFVEANPIILWAEIVATRSAKIFFLASAVMSISATRG